MGDATQIRTELTLDSNLTEAKLKEVAAKFYETGRASEKAESGFSKWSATAHNVLAVVGTNLSSIVASVRATGAAYVEAGAAAESSEQAVGSLIAAAQGRGARESVALAERLHDQLEQVGVKAGVAGASLEEAYQTVLERSGATEQGIKRATAETEKLALISAKLGKDVAGVSGEYALMGEGVLRTKGQLFQLLQSTGIFGDKTKGAAEAWGTLTDSKRAELLDYGLTKLSARMRDMPKTFNQASTSLANLAGLVREDVGKAFTDELTPALVDLTKDLADLRPDIRELGKLLAREVGEGVREGGRLMREALSWLKEHKVEIGDYLSRAATTIRETFTWVLDHKAEIAPAFGAGAALQNRGAIGAVVGGGVGLARGAASAAPDAFKGAGALLSGASATTVAGLFALTAAIAGVGLAAWQYSKLYGEMQDMADNAGSRQKELLAVAMRGDVEQVDRLTRTMGGMDAAAGRLNARLVEMYAGYNRLAEATAETKLQQSEQLRRQVELAQRGAASAYSMQQGGDAAGAANSAANQVAILVNAYNQATQQGNQAMALMAATTIGQSGLLKDAFLKSTMDIQGGVDAMADMLLASGGSFGAFATQLKNKTASPPAPKISMPGARITVNQDFRKGDPDAVAIAFKRGVAREVDRRVGSRYSGIFGN